MSEVWKWGNLTLAFLLELVAVGALAWWGWRMDPAMPIRLVPAIGLPVLAMVLWGLFAAPTATHGNTVLTVATKVLVFGGAAVGLWAVHYRAAAVAFLVLVLANLLFIKLGHLNA